MAEILKGKPAADAIDTAVKARADALIQRGIAPTLAIIRVGDDPDDCAYERGAMKRCSRLGISVRNVVFTDSVRQETIMDSIDVLNEDPDVDGILMLLPLPGNLNTRKACEKLSPSKDVDGVTQGSCAYLYSGYGTGFAPCTAEACIELLKYYQVPMKGSRIVVVGRSLVIGKPVSMLLLNENATVTTSGKARPLWMSASTGAKRSKNSSATSVLTRQRRSFPVSLRFPAESDPSRQRFSALMW